MITPQTEAPELALELGLPNLYFKREDLHPYGSHKGRSIPAMIDLKVVDGAKYFAISSSGNAALAAIRHIQKRNASGDSLRLTVFIGEKINPAKRQILLDEIGQDPTIEIMESPRPLQALTQLITGDAIESLRQSTDKSALVGYKALAEEIAPTPGLSAVFIGTSSGTTAQALADYFIEHKTLVAVHIIQTTAVSPIAQALGAEAPETAPSIALAIVDKVAHRKDALAEAIRKTDGSGWIATNEDILEAQRLLKEKAGIDATPNGALGFAGLIHALKKGASFQGAVVCVITGK